MLQVIRDNGMKLDGQLGTLITNMLILEQIAKDLEPNMNILGCAVPYFYVPQVQVKIWQCSYDIININWIDPYEFHQGRGGGFENGPVVIIE